MKISKVDGVRFATGTSFEDRLYTQNGKEEIDEHVKKRVEQANNLYNVFTLNKKIEKPKVKYEDRKKLKKLLIILNNVFKPKVEDSNKTIDTNALKRESKNLILRMKYPISISKEFVDNYVKLQLRRGLKSQTEFLQNLVKLLINENSTSEDRNDFIEKNNLDAFIKALTKDYNRKNDSMEGIVKSINNQKTNVIINDESKLCFTKNHNKKYLEDFLKKYVNDKDELTNLFIFIERDFFEFNINDKEQMNELFFKSDKKYVDKQIVVNKLKNIYDSKIIPLSKKSNLKDDELNKLYWFQVVHNNLKERYLKAKLRENTSKYINEYVLKHCRGEIKNLITAKYLQMGKAVYHFYDFDNKSLLIKDITSFHYELIKCKEVFHQKVNTAIVFTTNNFRSSLQNFIGNGDILLSGKDNFNELDDNDLKGILRYFGGSSSLPKIVDDGNNKDKNLIKELAFQIKEAIYSLRNRHFHYNDTTMEEPKDYPLIGELFKHELNKHGQVILNKYEANNVFWYYERDQIVYMIEKLNKELNEPKPFIPSFKRILSRSKINTLKINKDSIKTNEQFENALYFVLKEIYYKDFIHDKNTINYFIDTLQSKLKNLREKKSNKKGYEIDNELKALQDFINKISNKTSGNHKSYIEKIKNIDLTFPKICEMSIKENIYLNTKKHLNEKRTAEHFKMVLYEITREAFISFIKDKYEFLYNPNDLKSTNNINEDNMLSPKIGYIKNLEADNNLLEWYVLAKLIPPKELNMLRGHFIKYGQFISDINTRAKILSVSLDDDFYKRSINKLKDHNQIIKTLDLCQLTTGNISSNIEDYYFLENKDINEFNIRDEYAKKIGTYLEGCISSFKDLRKYDKINIYSDDNNPILHATIERSRMYGTEKIVNKVFTKISKADYNKYVEFKQGDKSEKINSNIEEQVKEDHKNIQFENRIKLHDIQKLSSIIIDIYSQFISWFYKYERDIIYFLMGFMYYKDKEKLKDIQTIGIYGEKYKNYNDNHFGGKLRRFRSDNRDILNQQMDSLFENKVKPEDSNEIRNDIDHMDYFKNELISNSLFEYVNFFTSLFSYDRKTQNSIMTMFINIIDRNHILCKVKPKNDNNVFKKYDIIEFKSNNFTLKYENIEKSIKKVEVEANSDIFIKDVETLLKYKS